MNKSQGLITSRTYPLHFGKNPDFREGWNKQGNKEKTKGGELFFLQQLFLFRNRKIFQKDESKRFAVVCSAKDYECLMSFHRHLSK